MDMVETGAVAVLSNNIKRAQLASNIIGGEPVDSLGPTIAMNERGLLKVFLFIEASGLNGRLLFHDWYWKGKRMAHTRIPIRRDSQTAASSKFIDRIMTGPWEVHLVDARGNILAKAAFDVR